MSDKEKYDNVFVECFAVSKDILDDKFVYQCASTWDSVGRMGMIAALEDAFGIMMDTEDVIEFGSYTIGIEKLKKYGIKI